MLLGHFSTPRVYIPAVARDKSTVAPLGHANACAVVGVAVVVVAVVVVAGKSLPPRDTLIISRPSASQLLRKQSTGDDVHVAVLAAAVR